jgi:hypothetical protein
MPIKFFPRDIIGKQPKKSGDKFSAMFMGRKTQFIVEEITHGGACIWGVLAK